MRYEVGKHYVFLRGWEYKSELEFIKLRCVEISEASVAELPNVCVRFKDAEGNLFCNVSFRDDNYQTRVRSESGPEYADAIQFLNNIHYVIDTLEHFKEPSSTMKEYVSGILNKFHSEFQEYVLKREPIVLEHCSSENRLDKFTYKLYSKEGSPDCIYSKVFGKHSLYTTFSKYDNNEAEYNVFYDDDVNKPLILFSAETLQDAIDYCNKHEKDLFSNAVTLKVATIDKREELCLYFMGNTYLFYKDSLVLEDSSTIRDVEREDYGNIEFNRHGAYIIKNEG